MPFAKVRGLNIRYEIVGTEGPWMALTTGGRRPYDEFMPLAEKIALKGFRVVLHDRRNTGASDLLLEATETEEHTWADDLRELLDQLSALPAFISGSSSGARTSMLFAIKHPSDTRGLLLIRPTGGDFAAKRLPDLYYDQFIRAAKENGMAGVCATEAYKGRIALNPEHEATLMAMDPQHFIDVMAGLRSLFVAGGGLPVMGVTDEELATISAPTIIIPGNDNTHASINGRIVHERIKGSQLHQLPIEDQDVPIIEWASWIEHEEEIVDVFTNFMGNIVAEE
ncbi:MAG: alpha/beta hydrolase [Rhodospirillaceae bacterium]